MKLKGIKIFGALLLVSTIIAVIAMFFHDKPEISQQTNKKYNETIEKIKEDTGMTANKEMYEIQVEYDGSKVLNIKPEIQYKIAFVGLIKNQIPKINEIDKIFEKYYPKESGIWIESNSRIEFLNLLNKNTNSKYEITEQGYLKIKQEINPNEEDKALVKMINGDKKYIVTISGVYYEADRVSGQILDNFFEEMDPYQVAKIVDWDGNYITILSTNKEKRLTSKEILQELTAYGK